MSKFEPANHPSSVDLHHAHPRGFDDWTLAAQATLRNLLHNWDRTRTYGPTTGPPVEGFTEQWGSPSTLIKEDSCWHYEAETAFLATPYPLFTSTTTYHDNSTTPALLLGQFRPAWTEQLFLAVTKVSPFIVVNSHYAVSESTGPLPYLQDLVSSDRPEPPVRVGRGNLDGRNEILEFLQHKYRVDLDQNLSASEKEMSQLYIHLIQSKLNVCLRVARYQDWRSWEQIDRPQSVQASSGGAPFTLSSWQVWCERTHERAKLSRNQRRMTTEQAVQDARTVYQLLEHQLATTLASNKKRNYLLSSDQPTLVDVLLWGHLAEALTNIHLVIELADFEHLCQYAQRLWDKYFCPPSTGAPEWQQWNVDQNAQNSFCHLPLRPHTLSKWQQTKKDEGLPEKKYQNAVDLMEQLSLQGHFLLDSLVIAKEVRNSQDKYLPKRPYSPFHTWFQWQVGANQLSAPEHERDENKESKMDVIKINKKNDQIWLATVATFTAIVLVVSGMKSDQK